jgi:hypothetical protein
MQQELCKRLLKESLEISNAKYPMLNLIPEEPHTSSLTALLKRSKVKRWKTPSSTKRDTHAITSS